MSIFKRAITFRKLMVCFALLVFSLSTMPAYGVLSFGPTQNKQVTQVWSAADQSNTEIIDHSLWQAVLDDYLIEDEASGVNLFDYKKLSEADDNKLADYIASLTAMDPRDYQQAEQFAYWVNLYNAVTVQLVTENYPVSSIKKIRSGIFATGPWNDEVVEIAGSTLSLNDIEHSILRPIWQDHRIHFAVNCASFGCPNLHTTAYTSANTETLLNQSARDYLNHPRGMEFDGKSLKLSTIFKWYASDFGSNQAELLATLSQYLPDATADRLAGYEGRIKYAYDWELNDVKQP